jgi:hypothetical protein
MKLLSVRTLAPALFAAALALVTLNACKKDGHGDAPACNQPDAVLSYSGNIKGIIDRYCISCHSGSGPGPDDYRTFEGMKSHLDAGHFLDEVVVDKTMPQGGGMPQSARDSINCWIQAGYPK